MRYLSTLLFLLFLQLVTVPSLWAEIRIIKLKYSSPEAFIATIAPLFGRQIKAAAAPAINAVVVNCDNPQIMQQIENLATELDRRPATLRFSLQRTSEDSADHGTIKLGSAGALSQQNTRRSERGSNSVVAMENQKARLTNDSIRIFSYPTYYGEELKTLTISRGLIVSGHLTGPDSAQLEIWYAAGEGLNSETLLTTVNAPLGHWVGIGGIDRQNQQSRPDYSLGKNSSIGINKSGGLLDRHYRIRVDLVSY